MKNIRKISLAFLMMVTIVFLTACGQAAPSNTQEPAEKPVALTISAAASLKDAMEEIKEAYCKDNINVTITYNFGSSGTLQQQIEQGAEVDLFISAAAKQMDALQEKALIVEETRKDLLGNRIVLVIPEDSAAVTTFEDLTGEKVQKVALGEPKSVPAGKYGAEALTKMNLLDAVSPKAVYGKDVKEVLTWVETGNADAGIVYKTDAKVSSKVKIVSEIPEEYHTPIVYPAAVIKSSKNEAAAKEFINFLCSSEAKPIFEKYGFTFLGK